jgi:phosphatidylcholine synthase
MAWGVHLLTASGVVVGLLALLATVAGRPREALAWLVVALVIDGLDGPLARVLGTGTHAPKVDGMILDLVVDYIPYVVVPAVFMVQFHLLPAPVAVPGAAVVMFTSLYCFARADMKARDQYFVGFPATWNLVVFVLYLLGTPTWFNAGVVVVLGVLTFTDVKFVHPVRVSELRWVTLPLTVAWLGAMVYLIAIHPQTSAWARALVVAGVVYQGFLTVRRSVRDFRARAGADSSPTPADW